MSRYGFTSTNYIGGAQTTLTATPLTISCWFYGIASDLTTGPYYFVDLHNSGSANSRDEFRFGLSATFGSLFATTGAPSASSSVSGSTALKSGIWYHCAAIFASATSRTAVLNGITDGTNTTSRVPSGINQITIGLERGSSTGGALSVGAICDVALWNTDLTEAECKLLYNGASPTQIRAQNLVRYYPLPCENINGPVLDEWSSHSHLTTTGTVQGWNDPYVILDRRSNLRQVLRFPAASAAAPLKTLMGLALASVKTVNGLAIASVKTVNGLSTT